MMKNANQKKMLLYLIFLYHSEVVQLPRTNKTWGSSFSRPTSTYIISIRSTSFRW